MNHKKPLADLRYFLAILNPFSSRIRMRDDLAGIQIESYKHDVIGRAIFKTGMYDPHISKWLIDRFKDRGGIFVDVGANLGYFTCLLGTLAGDNGTVISIEPEPQNIDLLRTNIAINGLADKVRLFPIALGGADGVATLNLYKKSNRGRHSLIAEGAGAKIEVPLRRLDAVIDEVFTQDTLIDFMKIDVEGYEPYVIDGAVKMIDRVQCLLMEYAPYLLNQTKIDTKVFLNQLKGHFAEVYIVNADSMERADVEEILYKKDSIDLLFTK